LNNPNLILMDIEIDAEVIQKNKTNPSLYKDSADKKIKHIGNLLYERVLRSLLSFIFRRNKNYRGC